MKVFHVSIAIILSFLPMLSAHALEREKSVANCAGEVVTIKGTVLVRQDSTDDAKAREPIALKPGNNLYPGDVVNTASDGAVKILLKDKTIIDLGGSALFKVAQFKPNDGANREVELDMMFGKMRVAVPKKLEGDGKFQIKTRAATMGVRGTEFVVSTALETSNENEKPKAPATSVVVLQGKVDVAKPGEAGNASSSMHLTAGNQVTTSVGAPPSAMVKLNETQLKTVSTSSKVTDNTFSRAVTIENTPAQRISTSATASNTNSSSGNGSSSRSPAEASGATSGSASAAAASAPLAGSLQSSAANIAAEVPTVAVSFSELGVPGATSVVNAAGPVTQNKSSYHVTVVVAQ